MDPDSAISTVILKIKQQQQQQKRMRRTTTINNNQSYIRQAFVNIRMVNEWEVSWTRDQPIIIGAQHTDKTKQYKNGFGKRTDRYDTTT